ncbi:MAG: CoA transferase [Gemmatimonadota bacterium]|jgi:crotonobetainyl-CoA:carnitine CoA-transferase CaiB-like acyl-CoA transferase
MLQGIRILDLSRVLAAPLATMTLADLGAEVIKVERPEIGDETRAWGPPFDSRGEAAYYLAVNRNKLGVALDLNVPGDRDVLESLIRGADVVVDNYRRGTLERKGLVPERFLAEVPSLIWCTVTGFGPGSDRPGYDYVVQAESGWMAITGEPEGEPMKTGVALADVTAGKDATIAILGALVARARATVALPVEQRRLFVSLWHSATAALVNVAQNVLVSGRDAGRWGNAHPNLVPYQLFRAADRHMVIAVGNDGQWQACCRALGLESLADDATLATNSGRLANREKVVSAIARRVGEGPAAKWLAVLEQGGVPCGVVKGVADALSGREASALTGVSPAVPGTVRLPPPRLDEHGALVREHGWGAFARA